MTKQTLAELTALDSETTAELRDRWRRLHSKEAPPYSRPYLLSRLKYRIQELSLGGLDRETRKRLQAIGDKLDGGNAIARRIRADRKPIAGTRLVREFRGIEHSVTVTIDGYDYQGRPFKSLSAVARAITGTRWNGWVFFGLARAGDRN